jgi:hypothetical protein
MAKIMIVWFVFGVVIMGGGGDGGWWFATVASCGAKLAFFVNCVTKKIYLNLNNNHL